MKSLSYEEYERLSESGRPVPVFREIPGDLKTPVSAFLSLGTRAKHAFLLESVLGGERLARYSFLGRDPVATLEVRDSRVFFRDHEGERELDEGLLDALRSRLSSHPAVIPGLPRFTGGAVGYLHYDAARLFERLPDRHDAIRGTVASFAFYDSLVAFDHVGQKLVLIAIAEPGSREAFDAARKILDGFEEDLRLGTPTLGRASRRRRPRPRSEPTVPEYQAAVRKAQEHIAAGDIFQVVLSRQHGVDCDADPFSVYRALRMVNPSPYMYFLKEDEKTTIGASPEMLVRVEGSQVETRPIAGTRPRPGDNDEALERELLSDEKERAEHLMLVDLGRNDLGRVCRFGSVEVPELMKVEHYSHVAHIVSSVTGELAEESDALDALAATFPAGTLSGAPKIRAMEIIDELEPVSRGLYGGALGYIDLGGNLDFCIAIRTLTMTGNRATLQAGAGIVADSDPAAEERETNVKAQALFEALKVAGGLA